MNQIRRCTKEDIQRMTRLEAICFSDPWIYAGISQVYEDELYFTYVYEENHTIEGYVIGRCIAGEGELLRIAVNPKKRANGIGAKLMDVFQEEMIQKKVQTVFLEVRQSNEAARKLYEQKGFQVVGTRPKYYHHPQEDAVLMNCILNVDIEKEEKC